MRYALAVVAVAMVGVARGGPEEDAAAALALAKARHTVQVSAVVSAPSESDAAIRAAAYLRSAMQSPPVTPSTGYYYPVPRSVAAPGVAAPRPFVPMPVTMPTINAPTVGPVSTVSPVTMPTARTTMFAPTAGRHGGIVSGCST